MKHRWLAAFLLLLCLLPAASMAQGLDSSFQQVIDSLHLQSFQQTVDSLSGDNVNLQDMVLSLAKGETVLDAKGLLNTLGQKVFKALSGSIWRIARLLIPAVLCGLINALHSGFAKETQKEICYYACFLWVAVFMVKDLGEHIALAQSAIDRMTGAMQGLFPILLTLLAAVGGTASAAFFQPAVVAASGSMTAMIDHLTVPFAIGAAILTMLDHLSDRLHLGRLASILRQAANWTLGVSFTVFIGVTLIQGLGISAVDGVSLRTAKYAIDNFVPIVGGMFADTVDTLVGASLLIKNALGTTGLILLISICAGPMIQSLAAVFVYRFSAALLQPVAESRVVDCMQEFSHVLMLLFVIQLSVSAMFILLIAQMLVVSNLTVMLR